MQIRKLEQKDSERMLQWMHDKAVIEKLQTDFSKKTAKDCEIFIENSITKTDLHMAIVDDDDLYMGTVSLKHITDDRAEFAITVHRSAMGKGYSIFGMREIIKYGFETLGLKYIYWCVASDNYRAISFYNKYGFARVASKEIEIDGDYSRDQINHFFWYRLDRDMLLKEWRR